MHTMLVDADVVVHAELSGCTEKDHFGDAESLAVDIPKGVAAAVETIEGWKEVVGADDVVLIFSPQDRSNFRRTCLDIGYKDNRSEEKAAEYWQLEDALKAEYVWAAQDYLEGDDLLGLIQTRPDEEDSTVIVSIDKDMKTIPGLLFNPNKMSEPETVTQREADYFWMYQTLCGDPVDGYKGCPGIGAVKATLALASAYSLGEMWEVVYSKFLKYYDYPDMAYQAALNQARASRILRHGDFKSGQVRLWAPTEQEVIWRNVDGS